METIETSSSKHICFEGLFCCVSQHLRNHVKENFIFANMSYEFSEGYQIRNQGATHFLTFSIEGWVDLFSRKVYKDPAAYHEFVLKTMKKIHLKANGNVDLFEKYFYEYVT